MNSGICFVFKAVKGTFLKGSYWLWLWEWLVACNYNLLLGIRDSAKRMPAVLEDIEAESKAILS